MATAEFLDGSPFLAFALMAALALDAAYPELDLAKHVNDRGRALVAGGEQQCLATIDGLADRFARVPASNNCDAP